MMLAERTFIGSSPRVYYYTLFLDTGPQDGLDTILKCIKGVQALSIRKLICNSFAKSDKKRWIWSLNWVIRFYLQKDFTIVLVYYLEKEPFNAIDDGHQQQTAVECHYSILSARFFFFFFFWAHAFESELAPLCGQGAHF